MKQAYALALAWRCKTAAYAGVVAQPSLELNLRHARCASGQPAGAVKKPQRRPAEAANGAIGPVSRARLRKIETSRLDHSESRKKRGTTLARIHAVLRLFPSSNVNSCKIITTE